MTGRVGSPPVVSSTVTQRPSDSSTPLLTNWSQGIALPSSVNRETCKSVVLQCLTNPIIERRECPPKPLDIQLRIMFKLDSMIPSSRAVSPTSWKSAAYESWSIPTKRISTMPRNSWHRSHEGYDRHKDMASSITGTTEALDSHRCLK